ncbi:AEC family transporter [Oceanobacillus halotolerans]|uniref:AEC family transporter n=1 Tax=Oceanobacillus halotolerans TaxID=2663380 RepID=UPI001CF79233|nr:AEC family transporter [Oceanobacillus halotolerans]
MFQVVIPIFAIIVCGFLAGRFSLLPSNGTTTLNFFVYYFALPALLFYSLSTASTEQLTNTNFILANLLIILCCFIVTILIFTIVFKKKFPDVSLYGMITSYGNTGFLGIPLLTAAFGQEAAIPAAITTFIYDVVVISFVIISFEISKATKSKQTDQRQLVPMLGSIGKAILLNPINLSLIIGITVVLLEISIPQSVYVFAEVLGPAAGPTALFSLGLGLASERSVWKNKEIELKESITLIVLKLIMLPILAFVIIHYIFPIEDDLWTTSLVILSALPTGALVYVFAEKYQTLQKQVPLLVLTTTVISIFTISIFLVFLSS